MGMVPTSRRQTEVHGQTEQRHRGKERRLKLSPICEASGQNFLPKSLAFGFSQHEGIQDRQEANGSPKGAALGTRKCHLPSVLSPGLCLTAQLCPQGEPLIPGQEHPRIQEGCQDPLLSLPPSSHLIQGFG